MLNRNSKRFLKFLRHSMPDFDDRVFSYEFIEENYPLPLELFLQNLHFIHMNFRLQK